MVYSLSDWNRAFARSLTQAYPVLSNISFILVRPSYPGNIGSAARVMKNFGLSDLRLVEPPPDYLELEDKWMAVGAFDLVQNAKVFVSLSDALKDVSLAVATSSARRRDTDPEGVTEVAPLSVRTAASGKVAWVFGNEQNGLTTEELERCHHVATIPTSSLFPVLNISQAAGIVAWELSRSQLIALPGMTETVLTTGAEDDEFFNSLDELLARLKFTRDHNRSLVLREIRTAFQRMHPSARELKLLKGALYRINKALEDADG